MLKLKLNKMATAIAFIAASLSQNIFAQEDEFHTLIEAAVANDLSTVDRLASNMEEYIFPDEHADMLSGVLRSEFIQSASEANIRALALDICEAISSAAYNENVGTDIINAVARAQNNSRGRQSSL